MSQIIPASVRLRLAALYALALAYGGTYWVITLHALEGAHEQNEPPALLHWLRDATLALPLVFLFACAALWLARRLATRSETAWAGAALPALLAGAASLAAAVGSPIHSALFGAHHDASLLPFVCSALGISTPSDGAVAETLLHIVHDGLLALPANLVIAGALALLLWVVPRAVGWGRRVRRPTFRRRALYRLVTIQSAIAIGILAPGGVGNAAVASPADPGSPCPAGAPAKRFDVQAIDVDIPLNRFGDHDPLGKMFVLTSRLAAVRDEERSRQVSTGLHTDPIQPLVIRANEGDCVTITFTNNASGGDYGIHIDGLGFQAGSSGDAVGNNPSSEVQRGSSATYRYYVPNDDTLEGVHYMHAGPGHREANNHGLFGGLVVEPPGSIYLDPTVTSADGVHPDAAQPLASGWEAMIVPGAGKSFRENVQMYHEIGNESEDIFDKNGGKLPRVDPHTETYRPGARAINYRSEPFMRRLDGPRNSAEQESGGYSSYTFGDPATIIPRSYLADPMKMRIMHAGSEVFHVFHMHGGGIRWRFNPKADPTFNYADTGLNKFPVEQSKSARLDAQAFGPGETYNLEIEGGSGGVQQAAGEFLFHCHIVKHYVSGMWGFWRVFNTLQPDLAPLPDRSALSPAVESTQLIGKTYGGQTITAANLDAWIRPQLPAQGVKHEDEDASVWDWTTAPGNPSLYLGEPEDLSAWPDFNNLPQFPGHPTAYLGDRFVGNRPVLRFNPDNGRYAWPLLRPHVGVRPPFAGNAHSGAPYLGETANAAPSPAVPIDPYANRADGLCPKTSPVRHYNIVAIMVRNQVTAKGDVDPNGEIFTLPDDKAAFQSGQQHPDPLAIRANVGDCIAVTLTTEQEDARVFGGRAKVNLHMHHVQFDTQASDGVITGMSFEQSIRPYKVEDAQLTQDARVGDTLLRLSRVDKYHVNAFIGVGLGTNNIELRKIVAIDDLARTVTVDRPLDGGCAPIDNSKPGQCAPLATPGIAHRAGDWAGNEYVQERWYPDVMLDNIFWHDHVDGIHNWPHGLVGMLNIEPRGSTYHDPKTGKLTNGAGTISDIHATNALATGFVDKSFREFSVWTINNNPLTDSTLNLRSEPWGDRGGDPALRFSSYAHGDPFTPIPRAYPGDPFVIRHVSISIRADTLHFDKQRLFYENRFIDTAAGRPFASPYDTIHSGISERFTLMLEGGAGGPLAMPGDYLYMNGLDKRFKDGAWGILRVLPGRVADLQPLPDRPAPTTSFTLPTQTGGSPPAATDPGNPCPAGAPQHEFAISAIDLPSNSAGAGQDGRKAAFVPTSAAATIVGQRLLPEPLVLHAAAGDCITVHFTNQRASSRASFHAGLVLQDTRSSGIDVGFNPDTTVAPGARRDYRFYADGERLESALITDFGGDDGGRQGLYGALVIAPKGATFTDAVSGALRDTGTQVDVHVPGTSGYRDVTLIYAEQDPIIGTDSMPYPPNVSGPALINYRTAGLAGAGSRRDAAHPFSSLSNGGDPATLTYRAYAGDPLRVHLIGAPGSEQMKVPYLGGMSFPLDPRIPGSEQKYTRAVGPYEKFDAHIVGGAGGPAGFVGDLAYADRRLAYVQAGMWGLFRVLRDPNCPIRPLDGRACGL